MHKLLATVCVIVLAAGCAGGGKRPTTAIVTLKAPAGTSAAAKAAVEEGNKLFEQDQWEQAKVQYEMAIKVEPTLAEAHYDLALTLERLGNKKEATVHYKEAANLAPGNQIIWNAPPFRRYSNEGGPLSKDKAFMDPKPY